jgi:hypothetical protein
VNNETIYDTICALKAQTIFPSEHSIQDDARNALAYITHLEAQNAVQRKLIEQLTDETDTDVMVNLIGDVERWRDAMGKVLYLLELQPEIARNIVNVTAPVDKY